MKLGHQTCHALHFMVPSRYTCIHCSVPIYTTYIYNTNPVDNKSCGNFNHYRKSNSTSISWFFVYIYIFYRILLILCTKLKTNQSNLCAEDFEFWLYDIDHSLYERCHRYSLRIQIVCVYWLLFVWLIK